jgi:hypothetical protein
MAAASAAPGKKSVPRLRAAINPNRLAFDPSRLLAHIRIDLLHPVDHR